MPKLMDKILIKTLQFLGLNEKQVTFFAANFKLGPATIVEITKASGLERSTAYLIASELMQRGFIEQDFKKYGKKLVALDPKKLLSLISGRQRILRRQELELEERLSELQALYQASEIRPKVRVFEGKNGLLSVWEDILSVNQELSLWTNQQTETKIFSQELHDKFVKIRIAKGISIRVLAVSNKKGKLLLQGKNTLRQTKFLPENVVFSAETYIYGNKIAVLDYNKDIIGIIIESEPIASSQRAIFEMCWNLI